MVRNRWSSTTTGKLWVYSMVVRVHDRVLDCLYDMVFSLSQQDDDPMLPEPSYRRRCRFYTADFLCFDVSCAIVEFFLCLRKKKTIEVSVARDCDDERGEGEFLLLESIIDKRKRKEQCHVPQVSSIREFRSRPTRVSKYYWYNDC